MSQLDEHPEQKIGFEIHLADQRVADHQPVDFEVAGHGGFRGNIRAAVAWRAVCARMPGGGGLARRREHFSPDHRCSGGCVHGAGDGAWRGNGRAFSSAFVAV